jgi:hypothetical protein
MPNLGAWVFFILAFAVMIGYIPRLARIWEEEEG